MPPGTAPPSSPVYNILTFAITTNKDVYMRRYGNVKVGREGLDMLSPNINISDDIEKHFTTFTVAEEMYFFLCGRLGYVRYY